MFLVARRTRTLGISLMKLKKMVKINKRAKTIEAI